MPFPWTTRKVAEILALPLPKDQPIHRITTDSRAAGPGSLFVAIRGETHDGHDFIPAAIAAGAAAVLSERPVAAPCVVFEVPSTLNAFRSLAHAWRLSLPIPVIAVVGAVGKTTTKELIASILSGRFPKVAKTEGSQNGFLGIPLSLLGVPADADALVLEIGIDEIGAMDQHLRLALPTHVILTRTGPEHLHQLKTVEIAAEEELRAFDDALARKIPLAINRSDEFVDAWYRRNRSALAAVPHVTYSLDPKAGADFTGSHDPLAQTLAITLPKGAMTLPCPLPGEHHAHNLLAAVAVCSFFGLTETEIQNGLSTFKTAYGRTEIYSLAGGSELIGDYYNSNPTSALAALKLLTEGAQGPTHAVLGDMLELGEKEEFFHRDLAEAILRLGVTRTWLYGPRMKWLLDELRKRGYSAVSHHEDHASIASSLRQSLEPGSKILVKGSRGMKMETLVKSLIETGPLA